MATWDRWAEYRNGTLPSPSVVQVEELAAGVHLAWVYTVEYGVVGPMTFSGWDDGKKAAAERAAMMPLTEAGWEFDVGGGEIIGE